MSCVLRISSENFDVDRFITESELNDLDNIRLSIYHKGEYINDLKRRVHQHSGFQIIVSNASFKNFDTQQKDAICFLNKYKNSFLPLSTHSIDGWKCLDFGLATWPSNHFSKTYVLAPELLELCGALNLEIWMSNYFSAREKRRENKQVRKFAFKKKWR